MENFWKSCQAMADVEKFYDDLIIINLYKVHTMYKSIKKYDLRTGIKNKSWKMDFSDETSKI